jgi:hypothetical protein
MTHALCADDSQPIIRSWWPLIKTWKEYAAHPQWTENYDKMFEARASELKSGDAQPLSQKEWRGKIRDTSVRRALAKKVEESCRDFITSVL